MDSRRIAGAPLVLSNGHALGALCVVDTKPRQLEPFQYEALRCLSRQVVALLELRRATKSLRHQLAEREWYETHLKQIQKDLEEQNASLAEQSRTDTLTGLPNRRSLDASLQRASKWKPDPHRARESGNMASPCRLTPNA
jgi:GAF domain-containing protein